MLNKANFVNQITVVDPDTNADVQLSVYKHQNNGMFAMDSSFIDQMLGDDFDRIVIPDPFEEGYMLELSEI
jgi:hypothetical protein